MNKNADGEVNKTDYLDKVAMVETIRSMAAELEKDQSTAEAALALQDGARVE